MVFQVPVQFSRPEEGTITYHGDIDRLVAADGLFSFSFYIRGASAKESILKQTTLYLLGLCLYTELLRMEPFQNWKMVVYTDTYTFSLLQSSRDYVQERRLNVEKLLLKPYAEVLLASDKIIFVEVSWPNHQRINSVPQINGPILRCFRSRVPFDFPNKLIFIRDADTLFDIDLSQVQKIEFNSRYAYEPHLKIEFQETFEQEKEKFLKRLHEWELHSLQILTPIEKYLRNKPLVIGAGYAGKLPTNEVPPLYKRDWHSNELRKKNSAFGVFAGLVNITPEIPIYQNKAIWDSFILYLNERSHRKNDFSPFERNFEKVKHLHGRIEYYENDLEEKYGKNYVNKKKQIREFTFSNNAFAQRIGRDEQFYLFFIIPNALKNIYFLRTDLDNLVLPEPNQEFHEERMRNLRRSEGGKRKTRRKKKSKN